MGCDGGTIPKRDELVKTKKLPPKNAKEIENSAKWNHCHLSQEILQKPIVADLLGYLYNKDALIQYLLERSKYEAGPSYIKNLKDIKELNLNVNPGFKNNQIEIGNEFIDANKSRWICPITGLEMNGVYKFFYIFACGCVISERALKSMQSSTNICLKCDKPYTDNDLIILNPNDDDLALNEEKYNLRKSLAKSSNKTKKIDNNNATSATLEIKTEPSSTKISTDDDKKKVEIASTSTKISNNNKRSHTQSEINKHSTTQDDVKRVKTIQDDPNASSVYKSLFTTHEKAKNQQKAHWVTYNPMFN